MVVWIEEQPFLTRAEVCAALGVKPQTLYAYVSRGVLHSYRQGKRRERLYLLREVEALMRLRPARERRPQRVGLPPAEEWIGEV